MSLAVRRAPPADMAGVARIYDHYVATSTATFELTPPGEGVWEDKFDTLQETGWPFLVAGVDDAVAGFAYVGPWRPRPAYVHTVEDTIYLDPAAVGRGIGTRLLDQVLTAAAAAAGAREVIAVVADGDTAASLALHRRAGFTDAGRLERVGRKFDRWLGTSLLQKALA